jgi:hypothetical protein
MEFTQYLWLFLPRGCGGCGVFLLLPLPLVFLGLGFFLETGDDLRAVKVVMWLPGVLRIGVPFPLYEVFYLVGSNSEFEKTAGFKS